MVLLIQAEIDRGDPFVIPDEPFQSFVGHAAKREVTMFLPVFRKQIDEGKKVDIRIFYFPYILLFVSLTQK